MDLIDWSMVPGGCKAVVKDEWSWSFLIICCSSSGRFWVTPSTDTVARTKPRRWLYSVDVHNTVHSGDVTYLSPHLSVCMFVRLSVCLSVECIYLFIYLRTQHSTSNIKSKIQ